MIQAARPRGSAPVTMPMGDAGISPKLMNPGGWSTGRVMLTTLLAMVRRPLPLIQHAMLRQAAAAESSSSKQQRVAASIYSRDRPAPFGVLRHTTLQLTRRGPRRLSHMTYTWPKMERRFLFPAHRPRATRPAPAQVGGVVFAYAYISSGASGGSAAEPPGEVGALAEAETAEGLELVSAT